VKWYIYRLHRTASILFLHFSVWFVCPSVLSWWQGIPSRICSKSCWKQRVSTKVCMVKNYHDFVVAYQQSLGNVWHWYSEQYFSVKATFCLCACFRTAIGIRGKDGVVFAVEKLVQSKLYERGSNKRIFTIDKHIGMVSIWFIDIGDSLLSEVSWNSVYY